MSDLEVKPKKRSTSIITVFLWLLLIAIMNTILVGSIFQENKLEYSTKVTLKVDFSDLLNDSSISQEYVRTEIIPYLGNNISFYKYQNGDYSGGVSYIGLEENIAIYEGFPFKNVHYMDINISNNIAFNILENGKILESGIDEYGNFYFEKRIDEGEQVYELKVQKLAYDTEATIKVDFTDYFNDENISQTQKNSIIKNFQNNLMDLRKGNEDNVRYYSEINGLDGNVVSYKIFFYATEADYIIFNQVYNQQSKYTIFENGKLLDGYKDKWNNWKFKKELTEGQLNFNFELKKIQLDSKVTLKVDFSKFLDDDTILGNNKEYIVKNFLVENVFLFSNDNVYIETKYPVLEENIATYEIAYNKSDVNYIRIYNNSFNLFEDGELLEVLRDDLGNTFFEKEIIDEQDVYEFEAEKRDFDRKITLKIDFSDFLNADNILINNQNVSVDEIKEQLIPFFYSNFCLLNDQKYIDEYISKYLGLEENIATYEISYYSSEANCIEFRCYICSILENGKVLEHYVDENGYWYCTKELAEGQDVYKFEVKQNSKLRINVETSKSPEDFRVVLYTGDLFAGELDIIEKSDTFTTYEVNNIPATNYTIYFDFEKDKLEDSLEYSVYEGDTLLDIKDGDYLKTVTYPGEDEYNFKIITDEKYSNLSQIYSNVEWIDQEKKEVLLEFGVDNSVYKDGCDYVVFAEKLADGFTISSEYENAPNWLIVNEDEIINDTFTDSNHFVKLDLKNNEYIPEYVYANLFFLNRGSKWSGKYQYIYLKDKNILYGIVKYSTPYFKIHLQYQGDIINANIPVNFETKVICFYNVYSGGCGGGYDYQYYTGSTLEGKTLNLTNTTIAKIDVNRLIENEIGNATYYVGLFENEEDNITSKIYQIDTVDGIGSTTITIENYDNTKSYYIYEIDKFGNKVSNEALDYSKNKVMENIKPEENRKIDTNKNIVSMVGTKDPNVVGVGLGEYYYNNNVMNINYVYKDIVTISSNYEEQIHVVKFEAGEGGRIEGETSRVVKNGETIDTIVNAVANEHYSFDKWIVMENGVEKEIDPSSYIITEDTTFIAKFKEDSYTVKYESAEGGRLEGNLEETVKYGESPVLIPSIILDESYEFDKWVVVENEVEMEVNLSSYKVEKDVTFIAKYNKIAKVETSDIEVWKYVGIGAIGIFVIVIIVLVIIIRKKNKNK